jgi:hypothetical protein
MQKPLTPENVRDMLDLSARVEDMGGRDVANAGVQRAIGYALLLLVDEVGAVREAIEVQTAKIMDKE